jgi:hypothetical protein
VQDDLCLRGARPAPALAAAAALSLAISTVVASLWPAGELDGLPVRPGAGLFKWLPVLEMGERCQTGTAALGRFSIRACSALPVRGGTLFPTKEPVDRALLTVLVAHLVRMRPSLPPPPPPLLPSNPHSFHLCRPEREGGR